MSTPSPRPPTTPTLPAPREPPGSTATAPTALVPCKAAPAPPPDAQPTSQLKLSISSIPGDVTNYGPLIASLSNSETEVATNASAPSADGCSTSRCAVDATSTHRGSGHRVLVRSSPSCPEVLSTSERTRTARSSMWTAGDPTAGAAPLRRPHATPTDTTVQQHLPLFRGRWLLLSALRRRRRERDGGKQNLLLQPGTKALRRPRQHGDCPGRRRRRLQLP